MNKSKICLALLVVGFTGYAIAAESSSASAKSGQRQRPSQDQQRQEPARGSDQGEQTQQRFEPPPRAYEECKGKKEGDAVQITLPDRKTISAKCATSPKGLFARPEHLPSGGQRREPPPQAFENCKGKKEGDAAQIAFPDGKIVSGICTSSPRGLFARPEPPLR